MPSFWNDEPILQDQLKQVSHTIEHTVSTAHGFIRPILLDHVQGVGKMLRPALVLITSQLGDHEVAEDAIRVGSIIELIHLASLVHDDILDSASQRRGKSTIYAKLGAKQAVLAGDFLLAKALLLTSGKERGMDSRVVSAALSRLCESELDQDAGVGNFFISVPTYLRRIAGKTASLFALSCYGGAALQEGPAIQTMRCHRIGYCMGMAFQIQDDILDYSGSSATLGKATGNDLKCGIPTLPLLYALNEERSRGSAELATLLSQASMPLKGRSVKRALELVHALGGVQKAQNLAESYQKRALKDIENLENAEVRRQLLHLFAKLSGRSL
ncbi:MAG: polyprenyl synthetase family protein [Sphaerochaeta sp.]|nr:polyprenyl synthetase family protein [Sphaerochaeta sp.]MDD3928415.1 polyprenyl synthetase family protein [Sphaerochaeta sp.]